jgi:YidC/Oxa1 family membrane protein insertase
MNFLIQFFYTILYQPLLNGLVWLYNFLPGHDLGLALVILTVVIRLAMHPLSAKSISSQKSLQDLQPKIAKIQEEHKNNKEAQAKAMMELYQKEKINPFSGCFVVLLQLPFLITLYYVAVNSVKPELVQQALYSFVSNPGVLKATMLWVLDLNNQIVVGFLAVLAGLLQFFQTRSSLALNKGKNSEPGVKQGDLAQLMQKQMVYLFPLISIALVWKLKGLIGIYWVVSSAFALIEQKIIYSKSKSNSNSNNQRGT